MERFLVIVTFLIFCNSALSQSCSPGYCLCGHSTGCIESPPYRNCNGTKPCDCPTGYLTTPFKVGHSTPSTYAKCPPCPAGGICFLGNFYPCPTGTFASQLQSTSCSPCPVDTWSLENPQGSPQCNTCPPNKTAPAESGVCFSNTGLAAGVNQTTFIRGSTGQLLSSNGTISSPSLVLKHETYPSVLTVPNTATYLFATDPSNQVMYRLLSGHDIYTSPNWTSIPDAITEYSPATAFHMCGATAALLLAINTGNSVAATSKLVNLPGTANYWGPFHHSPQNNIIGSPAIVFQSLNGPCVVNFTIFVVGVNLDMQRIQFNIASGWSTWESLGGVFSSSPAAAMQTMWDVVTSSEIMQVQIFGRNSSGSLTRITTWGEHGAGNALIEENVGNAILGTGAPAIDSLTSFYNNQTGTLMVYMHDETGVIQKLNINATYVSPWSVVDTTVYTPSCLPGYAFIGTSLSFTCEECPENTQEQGGVCVPCTMGSTAPRGSTHCEL